MATTGITTWTRTGQRWQPDGADEATEVVWVRVADRADFLEVGEHYGLPRRVLEHCASPRPGGRSRPHVELLEGGGVHLVAPTLTFAAAHDVRTGEVSCLILGSVVLTAESGEARILDRVAEHLGEPQAFPDRLTGGVLSALLSRLVESAAEVEEDLADAVANLEDVVFSVSHDTPVERIYALKREIAEARRALVPLGAELPELLTDPDGASASDAWVRRLSIAVERLDHRLEDHDELCADMLSAHLALVSVRQNEQMRRISAWAATLAVPTLVAAVYGMNFRHMPELDWTLGYPAALTFMGAVALVVNRMFHRSGWL